MFLPISEKHPKDFDFFIGQWNVAHQRLRARLANCEEWEHFTGACHTKHVLGGFGNVDDNVIHFPSGEYRAITIRSFNAESQTWSIWWLDARSPGALDVPVVGRFHEGVGTFVTNDHFEGKPIVVRFLWDARIADAPRWEQAFSPDDGQTWETNWIMQFRRSA
jgi:hypothetical protein